MNELITGWIYSDLGLFVKEVQIDPYGGIPNNFTLAPVPEIPEGKFAVFDGSNWRLVDEAPKPYIPPIQPWQVDQEKERRVSLGFIYDGKAFVTESQSQIDDILGMMTDSLEAITVDGAYPGNLHWASAKYEFSWPAADGTRVPMDAQTCLDFTRTAARRKSLLVAAGLALKAMDPIPADYMADKYWPPMDVTASRHAE